MPRRLPSPHRLAASDRTLPRIPAAIPAHGRAFACPAPARRRVAWMAGLALCAVLGTGLAGTPPLHASELIYRPFNPSFGGNPNLSSHLINLAQIQNRFGQRSGGNGGVPQINFPPISIDLGGVGSVLGGGNGSTTPAGDDGPQAPLTEVSN
jgi:hypothetical protein